MTARYQCFEFAKIDRLRCEWANRFGLVASEGSGCMGSKINMPPEHITAESFSQAIKKAQGLEVGERINCNITFEKSLLPDKLQSLTWR